MAEGSYHIAKWTWVKVLFGVVTGIFLAALYGPFIVMTLLSVTGEHGGPTFPMQGVSSFWYERLFFPLETARDIGSYVGDFGNAGLRSLVLALLTMTISTALATAAAHAFRRSFPASGVVFYLFLLGLVLPGIAVGLGHALFWQYLGVEKHWYSTALVGHILWTFPFCFIVMLTVYNRFDRSIEEAAKCVGATEWQTFRYITLPILKPGILIAALFGFTLSFDEFARTILTNGTLNTLPLDVLGATTIRVTPRLYAVGTLITLTSFCVIALFGYLITKSWYRARFTGQEEHER